jgi:hypothetical protein
VSVGVHAFAAGGPKPYCFLLWDKPHSTWAWKLEPLAGGRTRLITRLKARYPWRAEPANAFLSLILFEFGDFPMMRKLLLNFKQRAEQRLVTRTAATPKRRVVPGTGASLIE